ncbi:MAG: hypothetical protein CG445_171 [Methanosaeta sp. ASM2]|nr:MAG: hypothetical protein CG445_171 [Methanosaeta sp. ASM2]
MNEMMKIPASVICIGALLALLLHGAWAEDSQNATLNLTVNQSNSLDWNITPNGSQGEAPVIILGSGNRNAGKVLRAGFQASKPVNDLDVYGNRSVHVIPPQVPAQWSFDISQRVGNTSKFNYTNSFKPILSISPYFRTKAAYQAPSNLSTRPVYSISGYPRIKIASGIP